MTDEAATSLEIERPGHRPRAVAPRTHEHHVVPVPPKFHVRVRHGVRRTHNWIQLIRFGAVGAAGYVVNLAVFALCVHAFGVDYRVSAVIAWVVAVINNFWLNRHWTFRAKQARAVHQGARFFAVSLVAFGFSEAILIGLVSGTGMTKVLAQAIAIAAATPLNFVGQKLWSFRV
jgi:putative flippase GtrA